MIFQDNNSLKNKKTGREALLYLSVGIATAALNLGLYHLLVASGVDYKFANLIAIVTAKICAYLGNKFLVFQSRCHNTAALCAEIAKFVAARSFTGLLDYFGLIIAVEWCGLDKMFAKYILEASIVILNYLISKFLVFQSIPRKADIKNIESKHDTSL